MIFGVFDMRRGLNRYFNARAQRPNRDIQNIIDSQQQSLMDAHRCELLSESSLATRYGFFRSAWRLSKSYFLDSKPTERVLALAMLLASLGLTYYQVTEVAVGFNNWNRSAGDFLQNAYNVAANGQEAVKDAWDGFKGLIGDLGILTGKLLLVGYTNYKVTQYFSLRWRSFMTDHLEKKWLDNKAFYMMQFGEKAIDNPDQRIQEDSRKVSDFAVGIMTDAFDAGLSLATFSGILWGLSSEFNLSTLGGPDVVIPKFMFMLVMGYAALGTMITYYSSRPLEKVARDQERFEGNYRSDLKETHEKSESIALNNAETVQHSIMRKSFSDIYENTKKLISIKSNLLVLRTVYHRMAGVVPLLVCFPQIISGDMKIGGVFQVAGAFGEVKNAMSWYVNEAQRLREGSAYMSRIVELEDAIDRSQATYKRHGVNAFSVNKNEP
jgi:putative ATP-binding cassette transporter